LFTRKHLSPQSKLVVRITIKILGRLDRIKRIDRYIDNDLASKASTDPPNDTT